MIGDIYKKVGGVWVLEGNVRGAQGPQGNNGTIGADGRTPALYSAAGAPSTLHLEGDLYLNTTNDDLYSQVAGAWVLQGNLRGAQGTQGIQGTAGTNGTNGTNGHTPQLYSAAGAPSTTHTDGDLYLNTTNDDLYSQISGAWVLAGNLRGATGATGAAGANGTGGFDPTTDVSIVEDFMRSGWQFSTGTSFIRSTVPQNVVYISSTGTTANSISSELGAPGYFRSAISGTSSVYAHMYITPDFVVLGSNSVNGILRLSARIRLSTLSTSSQRYLFTMGLRNAVSGNTRNVEVQYSDNINAGKWRLTCTGTFNTSNANAVSAAPVAGNWTRLELVISANGSTCDLYVDGTNVATVSSNMPNDGAAFMGFCCTTTRQVGTNEIDTDIDYMNLHQTVVR